MDIKISINTDNDAFGRGYCRHEVGRILSDAAARIRREEGINERNLMDINGNTVGKIEVEE